MPVPPVYTVDEIFEAIKDLRLYYMDRNDACKLHSLSDPVWTHAHEKLPKMSRKYIYLYISTMRNGINEKILRHQDFPNVINSSKENIDDSYASNWSMNEVQKILPAFPTLRKTIYVSQKDYVQIKSCLFSIDANDKLTLTPGWTTTLYSLLWKNLKLPCPFAFKFANINENPGECILTVRGKCRECCNIVHIYVPTLKLSDKGMAIHVSTVNTAGVAHKNKRFLFGTERLAVVKELQAGGPYAWRRDNANQNMEFGDPEPAHLYSEDVLRKATQLENDRQLGLVNVSDPIRSVEKLQYEAEFAGSLKEVCLNKFYTFYWSAEQIYLYKETFKCKDCEAGSLSIDATGSLICRIKRPDGSSRNIFLYQAVVPFHGKILPVCQVVSEKHDANFISYWLREWRRSGVPNPTKVVTDCSLALLNAVCLAFSDCSLSNYVDICIKWLQSPDKNPRPPCIARIDIAHLIKFVCRWKCFEGKHFSVKDFFVRCVGLLTKCEDINSFRAMFCDVLLIALSETESINSDETNSCYAAQLRLMAAIKSDTHCYEYDKSCDDLDNEDRKEEDPENHIPGSEFINNLVAESKSFLVDGERPNPYYCHDFSSNIIRLAKLFPLWTAVMVRDKSSVATSSYSEEYFREIKQLILKGKSAIRVDKFLVMHMRSLAGATKILHALHQDRDDALQPRQKKRKQDVTEFTRHEEVVLNSNALMSDDEVTLIEDEVTCSEVRLYEDKVKEDEIRKGSDEDSEDKVTGGKSKTYLNEEETWKGKTRDKKKRGKFLRPCPDIQHRHERPKSVISTVPLLKNGLLLGPVKINNKNVMVRNTCPIDSIAQSWLVAFRDWASYQDYMTSTKNRFFEFVKMLNKSGCTIKVYKERAEIMTKFRKVDGGVLNCMMNVSILVKYLLEDEPSFTINHSCNTCKREDKEKSIVIEVDVKPFYIHGVQYLQRVLQDRLTQKKQCTVCLSEVTSTITIGDHVIVDIECLQWAQLAKNLGHPDWPGTLTIGQIPVKIIIENVTYTLQSIIEYVGQSAEHCELNSEEIIGHYIAHVRRITGRWEVHNDVVAGGKAVAMTARMLLEKKKISMLVYIKTN